MSRKIRVVGVVPNKEAVIIEGFDNSLENLKEFVNGDIEVVKPFSEGAVLITNRNSKAQNYMPNRGIRTKNGVLLDIICGSFVVVWTKKGTDSFCSLPKAKADKYLKMFKKSERLIRNGLGGVDMIEY